MSYLKKPGLLRQQQKLKNLIEERLKNEKSEIRQRVYQWLYDNQYFVDNELFDFYFCVAQNIAAVEILGGSGEKIVTAKIELDRSAQVFQTQLLAGSNQMIQQLEIQLADIRKKQDDLEWKLAEVLESLTKEQQNLQIISTGLVNSTTVLLKKQQQDSEPHKNKNQTTHYL